MQDKRKGRSKGALFVRLPHSLHEQVVALAAQERRTLTGQITLMLESYLEQREKVEEWSDFHRRLQNQVHGEEPK